LDKNPPRAVRVVAGLTFITFVVLSSAESSGSTGEEQSFLKAGGEVPADVNFGVTGGAGSDEFIFSHG
jgi:hypothetical protein